MAHGPSAFRGAAMTGTWTMEAVVDGEFLSRHDSLEAIEEDLAAYFSHRQIRIATMIDELGSTSSDWSIEAYPPIQSGREDSPCLPGQEHPYDTAHGFPLIDPLTGVLDDFLATRDRFVCEHPEPLNARTPNAEVERSEFRVETRNLMLGGHNRYGGAGSGRQSAISRPRARQIIDQSMGPNFWVILSGLVCCRALGFLSFFAGFFFTAMIFLLALNIHYERSYMQTRDHCPQENDGGRCPLECCNAANEFPSQRPLRQDEDVE